MEVPLLVVPGWRRCFLDDESKERLAPMTTRDTQANNPSYVTAEGLERMEEELEELRTAG